MGLIISETDIIECLSETLLKNDIPESSFGLKGFGEDRLCMERDETGWQVYYGYRGIKSRLQNHATIMEAAMDIIGRCSGTEEIKNRMSEEFRNAIYLNSQQLTAKVFVATNGKRKVKHVAYASRKPIIAHAKVARGIGLMPARYAAEVVGERKVRPSRLKTMKAIKAGERKKRMHKRAADRRLQKIKKKL